MHTALLSIAFVLLFLGALILWCGCLHRGDVIANLTIENDDLRRSVAELVFQREDALQLIAMKDKQISGHLKDSVGMLNEIEWLKSRKDTSEDLDADELIADVEIMLEAEYLL
jgi:hypothetical protein